MKRLKLKIFAAIMSAAMAVIIPAAPVSANQQTAGQGYTEMKSGIISPRVPVFTEAGINVSETKEGMLIEFSTSTVVDAASIGVKDIVIQKKVWYGWSTVAASYGGEDKDANMFGYSILYPGAEKGVTYRISCTHFADLGEYKEEANEIEVTY